MGCNDEFIIDAVTLIDYLAGDSSIISLISHYLGRVWVAYTTLEEVNQIEKGDCPELGLYIVEPSMELVIEALTLAEGSPLSFPDAVVFLLAKSKGLTIITNDIALRKKSIKNKIKVLWGLETIVLLVENSILPYQEAKKIANRIHEVNPKFISEKILKEFYRRIDAYK